MKQAAIKVFVAVIAFAVGVSVSDIFWFAHSSNTLQLNASSSSESTVNELSRPAPMSDAPVENPQCDNAKRFVERTVATFGEREVKHTLSGVSIEGREVCKAEPIYPPEAFRTGIQGKVTVQLLVDGLGRVKSARAISGHKLLREAAEQAARETLFVPNLLGGEPVNVSCVITYKFAPLVYCANGK